MVLGLKEKYSKESENGEEHSGERPCRRYENKK